MKPMRNLFLVGALLLTTLGWCLAADTGTLVVKTQDKGSPLPGVTVQVTNSKGLAAPQAKVTDGTGTATFSLPAGSGYTVTVTMPGFNTYDTADLKLELGKTKIVLYAMQEQLKEVIKVKGGKVVDIDEGAEGKVTFSDAFIDDLPVLGHSYQNVLTLAPGINDANGDGNPNVHGARERDFKATVDGVSNVDPLTGTFMQNINPDSIEEIEIVTTGASAEYGRAVGGFGKIITKQGGNTFETVSGLYLRSYVFDGGTNQAEGRDEIQYHDVRPSLNITGPIIKDKLFFALFHEYRDVGRPVSLLAGGGIVDKTKGSLNTDKLTWQATPRNKLIFQAQADPIRRGPRGIDTLTDLDSGYDYKQGGPTYTLRWNAQLSSVLNVESLLASTHTGIDLIPETNSVRNSCALDTLAAAGGRRDAYGNLGGEPIDEDYCFESRTARRSGSYFQDHSDERYRYTVKSDATYFMENFLGVSHTMKGGVILEKERYTSRDSLRSVSQFSEVLTPPTLDQAAVTGGGVIFRTVYTPGFPDTGQQKANGTTYGMYLEDQFRPHTNVSVRVGVRVEKEVITSPGFQHFDPKQESDQFNRLTAACEGPNPTPGDKDLCARANFSVFHRYEKWPFAGSSPLEAIVSDPSTGLQSRVPETFRIGNTNIGPRFSISWDPRGDQKTKLFASAGRVYDKIFLGIPDAEQGPDSFGFRYKVEARDDLCQPDPDGNGTFCQKQRIVEQADNEAVVSPATINQVDRNLRTPYVDEYTAGFSREIAPETSITFTYIRRRYQDQFQDIDINHYAVDLGKAKEGCYSSNPGVVPSHPINTTPDGVLDDCVGEAVPNTTPTVFRGDGIPDLFIYNPFFNQIKLIGNFNQTRYTAYQLELNRRLHRNWQLEGSYVWSKAEGNAEDFNSPLGDDPTTKQDEQGFLDYDQRHLVKVNVTTQIPLWNVRLGSSINWASGLPFSLTKTYASFDQPRSFGNTAVYYGQFRTIYPTHQRNDHRSDSYWLLNLNAKKDFTLGKANVETSIEVFNLLNNTYLRTSRIANQRSIGTFNVGRQFQIGAKVSF